MAVTGVFDREGVNEGATTGDLDPNEGEPMTFEGEEVLAGGKDTA